MIYQPLQYYVDKLKNGERFSLARYGDGELYCMWGRSGRNSNGCWYSSKLSHALNRSLKHKDDPTFIYGLQRVLPKDQERAEKYDVNWHDSEFLGEAVANGELYPLIKQLRKMNVCFIGNESIKPVLDYFPGASFVEVPPDNAYEEHERVISEIKNYGIADVYLFSCGMASNAFISRLHGKVNAFLIDVGHIWDPFVGKMSRCDLIGKTKKDIDRNLKP